ncbi:MAG: restriction endonuclease subunit S [Methanotrichaceae archaeon]|nr:restriction endonuclease subunit S [Methanotrichaceae archaeon]
MNEIAILINGKAFKESEWANKGLPIVRIQNLKDESAPFNYYQGETNNQFLIDNGELLFSWSGSKGTSFGPHFWWGESAVLNQHIFKVLIKPEIEVDKFFLYYYLLKITTNIEDLTYGLAALVHVRKKDLENVSLYLPPLPEQRAIARALRAVQGAREARLREAALERERKAALMEHLFTHGTRGEATKMTEIGEMPESWKVVQLDSLLINGLRNGLYKSTEFFNKGFAKIIELSNLYNSDRILKVDSTMRSIEVTREEIDRYSLNNGDLIINRVSKRQEGVAQARLLCLSKDIRNPILYESNMFRASLNDRLINPNLNFAHLGNKKRF